MSSAPWLRQQRCARCWLPTSAGGHAADSISAGFSPLRLGAPTALSLGFDVRTPDGSLPSALTGIVFHYPANLGIGTSGLGVASCAPAKLSLDGPKACPPQLDHGPRQRAGRVPGRARKSPKRTPKSRSSPGPRRTAT